MGKLRTARVSAPTDTAVLQIFQDPDKPGILSVYIIT